MKKITNNKTIQKIVIITFIFITTLMPLFAQDTTLPVGFIPGVIDVSPMMGATTYTISIEVVPGTQGIQPNLSIVYNSMSGMGLLGMKWGLVGLSAITRSGQLPYYNDNLTAIQFSNNDRFNINGDRLGNLNGNYGDVGTVYATHMEDFTRFFSHDGTSGHPSYFMAFTDDGSIIEYGNTTDSKQTVATNKVLSWYINKITDFNGNTMTYHYGGINGEIWIDSIKYTGNTAANITPYAKVAFLYTDFPDTLGRNTFFAGGYGIPQTKLLETITVSYNNTQVRKYQFNYNLNDSGERSPHLKEIVLYGVGGIETLNATSIIWGDPYYEASDIQNSFDGYMIMGDFNGDGFTDYVVYGQTNLQNTWTLYTGSSSGSFTYTGITGTHENPGTDGTGCYFYKADVNGDGCDELIIADTRDDQYFNIRILSLKNEATVVDTNTVKNFYQLYFGDFDGDGNIDFLILLKETSNNNKCSFQFYIDSQFTDSRGLPTNMSAPCKVRVGDFTGSGKTDVELNYSNNDLYICYFNNDTKKFYYNYPLNTATYLNERYSGDFNGDGIADLLIFDGSWKLYFGKGDGTFTNYTNVSELNSQIEYAHPYGWVVPRYKILIADIDGDGKDDIVQLFPQYDLIIIYSKGCINGQYKYTPKNQRISGSFTTYKSFNIADFDNDGILDIVVKERTGQTRMVYLNKNRQYEFLKEITDGLGKTYKFVYKPKYLIANNNTSQKYFCHIVDNLQISNGIDGFNSFQYKYNQPAFSWLRRSFLGFYEVVSINNQEDKIDSCFYTFDNVKQLLIPASQKTYYDITHTNETIYNFSFQTLANDRYVLYSNAIIKNILNDTKTETTTTLSLEGRLANKTVKTYNACNALASKWVHSETSKYTYQTITLNGNQQKTVPIQILTTQMYGILGVVIADTLTYDYSGTGRLNWQRQGNIDGSITTAYGNYTAAGLFQKKTVSAAGCEPRTETYTYDTKQRFVTQIKNPLNFSTNFTYYENTGNRKSETDINGLTTNYTYDSFGQLTKINYPDGTVTKDTVYWFSGANLPNAKYCTKTTSSGKPDLTVYYDILGREVCRLDDGYYYETRYNNKGQVIKTSFPFSKFYSSDTVWNYYSYDSFGRKSTEITSYADMSYSYNIRKVTVTDHLRSNIQSYKDYDALGRIVQAHDAGGDVTYAYTVTNNKRHQTTITTNGATTKILSDLWGNRGSITEPNAGIITSTYNKFNELIEQIDANENITSYQYDKLGRITKKEYIAPQTPPQTIRYFYDNYATTNKGKGKIFEITINNILEEKCYYDTLSRLVKHIKNDCGGFTYTYTPNGQIETINYPGIHSSQLSVTYRYTSTGKLRDIRNSNDNSLIYKVDSRNKFGATTLCEYGNEVVTDYTYNPYGLLTRINTGNKLFVAEEEGNNHGLDSVINEIRGGFYTTDSTILNYRYAYDTKGLMSSRSESVINRPELFYYDNLDRLELTVEDLNTYQVQIMYYANNGNITNNYPVGYYNYNNGKPHAVSSINSVYPDAISEKQCDVDYNFFNQPVQIEEGDYKLELSYDAHQQRKKTTLYKNDAKKKRHIYYNKYCESEIDYTLDSLPVTHYYQYIYGDEGVVAMYKVTRTGRDTTTTTLDSMSMEPDYDLDRDAVYTDSMYYIHTDHLGSYCAITNASKAVRQRNWFDPWGNYPIKYDTIWARKPVPTIVEANFPLTSRGFTGHEHYPMFKIINMNGRLYDPVIARFFSPDKYVANSSFTQDFNRYSYARNNPLMYTDPSGNEITGYDVFSSFFLPIFFPARVLSEGFTWINDKINGDTRAGYFPASYLMGKTEPYSLTPYNPTNYVHYGQPGHIPMGTLGGIPSVAFGTGWAMGADNEWNNILDRPILMKLSKRFLYSASRKLGIDPGKPIPETYRNSGFANAAKSIWFKFAPNPSGGIRLGNEEGKDGWVIPDNDGKKFLGGSIMFLHEENAFTSLENLFYTLGHELVHVSQFLALEGLDFGLYRDKNFRNALDFFAYDYVGDLGGRRENYYFDLSRIDFKYLNMIDHRNYLWTYLYNKPF